VSAPPIAYNACHGIHGDAPARDILKNERNIILKGADAASKQGFTQVPNFLLKSKKLSAGDKMTFAMILSYAWQKGYSFPGQKRLAEDLGIDERNVRRHLKSLLAIQRRGQVDELRLNGAGDRSSPDTVRRVLLGGQHSSCGLRTRPGACLSGLEGAEGMIHKLAVMAALAAATCCSAARAEEPLAIAKQSYFFVGGTIDPNREGSRRRRKLPSIACAKTAYVS
jgi:hypothetical protein